jgi:hypothetical protein
MPPDLDPGVWYFCSRIGIGSDRNGKLAPIVGNAPGCVRLRGFDQIIYTINYFLKPCGISSSLRWSTLITFRLRLWLGLYPLAWMGIAYVSLYFHRQSGCIAAAHHYSSRHTGLDRNIQR